MTKLRLIKPWGLRTVRQQAHAICEERTAQVLFQACKGPVAERADVAYCDRFGSNDIRSAVCYAGTQRSAAAPVVTVVHARFAVICIR
ncbi:MAG: hypothetical protein V4649_01175 [Bacteroidota bacterium]